MCKAVNAPTQAEYEAVRALLAIIAGYRVTFDEVKGSELLSLHFKYTFLLAYWNEEVINAFIDKLNQEQRYSLILLNKLFAKISD